MKEKKRKLVVWAQAKGEPMNKKWYVYEHCATRSRAERLVKSLRNEMGQYFLFKVGGVNDEY